MAAGMPAGMWKLHKNGDLAGGIRGYHFDIVTEHLLGQDETRIQKRAEYECIISIANL